MLLGVSVGGFWTFAAAAGRRLVPEVDRGRATVVGVPLGTALGTLAGWRVAFGSVAALAGLTALGQGLLLSRLPSRQVVSLGALVGVFKVPATATGFLAAALITAGHFTAYTYLEPFLSRLVHLTPSGISGTLAAYGAAGVLGTFAGERATASELRRAFIGVALLLGLAILTAAASGAHATGAVIAVVLWGAAFGAVPVCPGLDLPVGTRAVRDRLGDDGDRVSDRPGRGFARRRRGRGPGRRRPRLPARRRPVARPRTLLVLRSQS